MEDYNFAYVRSRANDMLSRSSMLDALEVTSDERETIRRIAKKNSSTITKKDVDELATIKSRVAWDDEVMKNARYLSTINKVFGDKYKESRQLKENDAKKMLEIKQKYEHSREYVSKEDREFVDKVRQIEPITQQIKPIKKQVAPTQAPSQQEEIVPFFTGLKKPIKKVIIDNFDLVDPENDKYTDNINFSNIQQYKKKEAKNENDVSLLQNKRYRSKDNCG